MRTAIIVRDEPHLSLCEDSDFVPIWILKRTTIIRDEPHLTLFYGTTRTGTILIHQFYTSYAGQQIEDVKLVSFILELSYYSQQC
jgi:hypothetical protein